MVIKTSLYGGEVELVFNSLMHRYTVNGQKVPSVTTILGIVNKPALLFWSANQAADHFKENLKPGVSLDEVEIEKLWNEAKKAHTQKKEDASVVGSFAHKWVEMYIRGQNPEMPTNPQVLGAVQRFKSWVEENNVKFLSAEQPIYSRKHNYCGTVDFFCFMKGKLYIGDLKTSNYLHKNSMGSQLAAYRMARMEEFPTERYTGAVLVRVGKTDGELEVWETNEDELSLFEKNFLNCLALTNSEEEIKLKYGI